ncbi:hypothetical protein NLG97_g6862 [Lecanicillium saksenae]|uniref:Uncharacterized protein n=1 Tax=Lecanicillium saksenae TaxID=468837 RepID=A0ACC1QQS0_9HYPO|nr:hypothetical protein NLG97_g6862 [Lecanicillium saksenae]
MKFSIISVLAVAAPTLAAPSSAPVDIHTGSQFIAQQDRVPLSDQDKRRRKLGAGLTQILIKVIQQIENMGLKVGDASERGQAKKGQAGCFSALLLLLYTALTIVTFGGLVAGESLGLALPFILMAAVVITPPALVHAFIAPFFSIYHGIN